MRIKRFITAILLLALCLSFTGCKESTKYNVSYIDYYGNEIKNETIKSLEDFNETPCESVTDNGKTYCFYGWNKEIVDNQITATALYYQQMEDTKMSLTNADIFKPDFSLYNTNSVLVVYVSFTDGYQIDKNSFEDMFVGNYEGIDSMRSVSSYFRETSGGKNLLDFDFYYYDCNMTSAEAWHLVNDEDSYGDYYGNYFVFDIFEDIRKENDLKHLDKNNDGFVDACIFVLGDTLTDGRYIYGGASGNAKGYDFSADFNNPEIGNYVKTEAYYVFEQLQPGSSAHENTRMLIHEISHLFGIVDYYDYAEYQGEIFDTLGSFDMQSYDLGGWNPFSKMTCDFLSPYVITNDIDDITLKLSAGNEAILIPTSCGYNDTPYDEYILIDVLSKEGPNGFDWSYISNENSDCNKDGGVRIYHVDARLVETYFDYSYKHNIYNPVNDFCNYDIQNTTFNYRFPNSNGVDPNIEGDSRFYHLIEIVPRDGTSKYRKCTPQSTIESNNAFTFFNVNDLFGVGDSFSVDTHYNCFANGKMMNNGGTLDYVVTVLDYNGETGNALINIKRKY